MMMKPFIFCFIALILFAACGKSPPCKTYSYAVNKSYTGSHTKENFSATITVTAIDTGISYAITLKGNDENLEYPVHIHEQESGTPFGYSGNPVINIGHVHHSNSVTFASSKYSFDFFTKNFKGYFLVHDPKNVINDTLSLLAFGKIGSW